MARKLKPKKCRRCKTEFVPVKEWQKFCSKRCGWTTANRRRARLVRIGQKVVDQQDEAGHAA